jgi:hypothetical protein
MSSTPSNNLFYKIITYGIFMPIVFIFMIGFILYEWITIVVETTYIALTCVFNLPINVYNMTNEILERVLNGEE